MEVKKRVNYIDALRGFTMILVVLMHVELFGFGVYFTETTFGEIMVSFRMPMFFFVSGYIAYKASAVWSRSYYWANLNKKAVIQIIPTIFFFSLYCIVMGINPIEWYLSKGFDWYWFTFTLFEMFVVFYTASFVMKRYVDVVMIAVSVLGVIMVALYPDLDVYSEFANFLRYVQFFTLGILAKKYNARFLTLLNTDVLKAIAILIFIMCIVIVAKTDWIIAKGGLYSMFIRMIARYAGIFIVFAFFAHKAHFFDKDNAFNRCLLFIGRRTLDIYLLHYFFIPNFLNLEGIIKANVVTEVVLSLLITLVIVGLCLLVSEVIRSSNLLGHYLFGVKLENRA